MFCVFNFRQWRLSTKNRPNNNQILLTFILEWTNIMSCSLSFGYSSIECTHRWLTFTFIVILQFRLHLNVHFSWLVYVLVVYPCTRKQVTHTCLYTVRCSRDSLEVYIHAMKQLPMKQITQVSKHTSLLSFGYSSIESMHCRWLIFIELIVLLLAFEHALVCVLVVYPCMRKQVTHASLYTVRCSRHSLEVYAWWTSCP